MLINLFKKIPQLIHNIIPSPFPPKLKLDSKP
jgi:hypothetical protein